MLSTRLLTLIALLALVRATSIEAISLTDFANVRLRGEPVEFRGTIVGAEDVSGIAVIGEFLVLASDEVKNPTIVQVLKREGANYRVLANVQLPGAGEFDLEAVAADGNVVYITGSHASTRKIKDREIRAPERKESRQQIFRFRLDETGSAGPIEGPKSLGSVIEAHPVLGGFIKIASKENGIDIEGLAVKNGSMYFGFRGPVLRDGWVPILVTTWENPAAANVVYVQLDGRGIRDIAAVKGGFLILAGPIGDGDISYRLYFWNGADQLGGQSEAKPQQMGEFSDLGDGKPEGLAVLSEQNNSYYLLIVCDGLPNGAPTRWLLKRP